MKTFNTTVAIDIGTHKVSVIIAKILDTGEIEVLGLAHAPTGGMNKGIIQNLNELTESIRLAVNIVQEQLDVNIVTAWVSIPSLKLFSNIVQGASGVESGIVEPNDLANAFEHAKVSNLPTDHYLVHAAPFGSTLNGEQLYIHNPIGMVAEKITSLFHFMTLPTRHMQNFSAAVQNARVKIERVVLSQMATAESTLLPTEREHGICLIDIGGAVTTLSVYIEDRLAITHSVDMGGEHVTRDLASVLQTSFEEAEIIKLTHGTLLPDTVSPAQMYLVRGFTDEAERLVPHTKIVEIIMARYALIFDELLLHLHEKNATPTLGLGVILTGRATNINGMLPYARLKLKTRVQNACPAPQITFAPNVKPESHLALEGYSTAIGLLIYSQLEANRDFQAPKEQIVTTTSRLTKFVGWFKKNF